MLSDLKGVSVFVENQKIKNDSFLQTLDKSNKLADGLGIFGLMFLIYLIIFGVYTVSIILIEKGYFIFLGASGIILLFYIIILGFHWFNGSKKSKSLQELIEEKLRYITDVQEENQ